MRKPCIVVDVDNTLVDAAKRKLAILEAEFSMDYLSIDKIRDDFELNEIFGRDTEARRKFFEIFDSEQGIATYQAPLFPHANEVIESIVGQGITVIYLTARPEILKDVTKKELSGQGLDLTHSHFFFRPNHILASDTFRFKENVLRDLTKIFYIITSIGDRIEDINAAAKFQIPSILFTTTLQPSQILNAIDNPAGFQICADWREIEQTINMFISGNTEIRKFRSEMIDMYSKWLGEIDNKLRVSVSIASIICALSGKILLDSVQNSFNSFIDLVQIMIILFVFIFGLISLIFSIRSLTSRFTSGDDSGRAVKVQIKQGLAILFGRTNNEMLPGDAIDDLIKFKESEASRKATAHRTFFYKKYKTYDPDALWNFRFFSIRAANYSKLYGERFASYLLIVAILLLGLWILLKIGFGSSYISILLNKILITLQL